MRISLNLLQRDLNKFYLKFYNTNVQYLHDLMSIYNIIGDYVPRDHVEAGKRRGRVSNLHFPF